MGRPREAGDGRGRPGPRGHVSEPAANSVTRAKGIFLIYIYIMYHEGEKRGNVEVERRGI